MPYDRPRTKYHVPLIALGIGAGIGAVALLTTLRKRLRTPFEEQQWADALDGLGRIKDPAYVLKEIAEKGLAHSLRKDVWPFLVGVFPLNSTAHDRDVLLNEMTSAYNKLLLECQEMERALADAIAIAHSATPTPPTSPQDDHPPVATEVVQFGEAHRIIILDAVRTDFKHRAYPQPPPPSSSSSSAHLSEQPQSQNPVATAWAGATKLVNVWFNGHFMSDSALSRPSHDGPPGAGGAGAVGPDGRSSGVQQVWCSKAAQKVLQGSEHLDPYRRLQAQRLVALLSAYAVYDPQTGYCQGMSDLAAPFLVLMEDDALAFWCFAALMARARGNFSTDESGMWGQLSALAGILEAYDRPLHHRLRQLGAVECHFAYRMILVMMRREVSMDKAMHLWEMVWAEALLLRQEQRRLGAGPTPLPPMPGPLTGHFTSSPWALPRASSSYSESGAGGGSGCAEEEWSLFLYLVAAVVWLQRRQVLDDCHDHDAVLQLFSNVRVSTSRALGKARQMRAQLEGGSTSTLAMQSVHGQHAAPAAAAGGVGGKSSSSPPGAQQKAAQAATAAVQRPPQGAAPGDARSTPGT